MSESEGKGTGVIYPSPLSPLEGNTVAPFTKILHSIRNYTYIKYTYAYTYKYVHINAFELLNISNILTNISCHRKAVFSAKTFPITFQKAIHYPNNSKKRKKEKNNRNFSIYVASLSHINSPNICSPSTGEFRKSISQKKYHWHPFLISAVVQVRRSNVSINNIELQSLLPSFQRDEQFLKSNCRRCTFTSSSKAYKDEIYCDIYYQVCYKPPWWSDTNGFFLYGVDLQKWW